MRAPYLALGLSLFLSFGLALIAQRREAFGSTRQLSYKRRRSPDAATIRCFAFRRRLVAQKQTVLLPFTAIPLQV